jgi:DNA-directed RNA polymerase specialized sigma24 family protein
MRHLDPKDLTIRSLFYLNEKKVIEVAVICGIPPGSVKSRLYHAHKNLKSLLENETN